MMAYSDDDIALAAEYALGTLDAEERAQVESMMSIDADFKAVVQAWEHKLGVLNQMVGSVEPRPEVWEKIKAAVGRSELQEPPVLPEQPAPPVAPSVAGTMYVVAETVAVICGKPLGPGTRLIALIVIRRPRIVSVPLSLTTKPSSLLRKLDRLK